MFGRHLSTTELERFGLSLDSSASDAKDLIDSLVQECVKHVHVTGLCILTFTACGGLLRAVVTGET